MPSKKRAFKSSKELTEPRAMVIVALIGAIPALITGFVTWQVGKPKRVLAESSPNITDAEKRLDDSLRAPSGYQKRIYSNLGFGFIAPKAWQVEDFATRFGVADIDVIQRYTDEKAVIGVEYKLIPVQPNYVNDHATEVRNQTDVWEKIDPNIKVDDATISGFPAKRFAYTQPTGKRIGEIRRYWVRIVPEVKLQILCFTYMDAPDRNEYWSGAERIVDSTIIDRELLEQRRGIK